MTKHTPGPWIVETRPTKYPDLKEYSVLAPHGWREADGTYCRCSVAINLDSSADAHLIAAAPDMLAALHQANVDLFDLLPPTIERSKAIARVRAAIAKAEGVAP